MQYSAHKFLHFTKIKFSLFLQIIFELRTFFQTLFRKRFFHFFLDILLFNKISYDIDKSLPDDVPFFSMTDSSFLILILPYIIDIATILLLFFRDDWIHITNIFLGYFSRQFEEYNQSTIIIFFKKRKKNENTL